MQNLSSNKGILNDEQLVSRQVLLNEKNMLRACVLNEIIKLDDGGKAVG